MSRFPIVCAFASEFCETEVENFNDAIVPQHDVVRLDVAMNDADAVSRGERAGDLNADVEASRGVNGASS